MLVSHDVRLNIAHCSSSLFRFIRQSYRRQTHNAQTNLDRQTALSLYCSNRWCLPSPFWKVMWVKTESVGTHFASVYFYFFALPLLRLWYNIPTCVCYKIKLLWNLQLILKTCKLMSSAKSAVVTADSTGS